MIETHPIFNRYPELVQLVGLIKYEVQQSQRPPEQIVMTDQDVMKLLKISKRKLDYLKADKIIPFHQPVPRSSCYFLLSDLLHWLKNSRVESIHNERKY